MADAPVAASLNESAIKRFDPYVKEIIDTAKYVALYSFVDNVWTKTRVEGSLFVYARSGEPLYNILVLNRLDSKNLIEPITPQLDLQRSEPYLLYKNSEGNIFGIWFFDVNDCVRLTNLIQSLMDRSASGARKPPGLPNNGQAVDIFQMLTKAQEAYSAKEGRPMPARNPSPKNEKIDGTPRSVVEFFAKAGSAPTENAMLPRTKTISESDSASGLLQQLKANPAHSVEHIEKQQRVVTPHSTDSAADPLKQFLRPQSSGLEFPKYGTLHTTHEDELPPPKLSSNGFSAPIFPVSHEEKKPDLMPPAMFTHREAVVAVAPPPSSVPSTLPPEPLTRNQLLQAFDYLLRHDTDFMTKIHEAYVKSLTEKLL